MNNRMPFVGTALTAAVMSFALCGTLRRAGAHAAQPRIQMGIGVRPATMAAALAAKKIAEGQDVVGRKMPALRFNRWLNTPDNKPLDTAGHVTLYRWWTDGCAHCEKTLPAVERLRQKYGPRGLRVVAVYHPKPPRPVPDETIRAAAKEFGYAGAVAVDQDWSALKSFYLSKGERTATSASFLVGRDGVIAFCHPGPRFYPSDDPADLQADDDYRRIEAAVKRLVDQSE